MVRIHMRLETWITIADIPESPEVSDFVAISLKGIVSPSLSVIRDLPI
jgi:hypothetical protein